MEFFYVTEDFTFNIPFEDGNKVTISLNKPKGKPDFSTIYASTGACVATLNSQLENARNKIPKTFKIKLLNTANKEQIYENDDFPIVLSNFDGTEVESKYNSDDVTKPKLIPDTEFIPLSERVQPKLGQDSVSVMVINGMGTGLGDGIIGLSALNIFYKEMRKYFKEVKIDLTHTAVVGDKAHQSLYSQEGMVGSLTYLPIPLEKLMGYDFVIDNSAMIIRESFPKLHMIDFYLRNMSIDPKSIADHEKRIFIKKGDTAEKRCDTVIKTLKEDPTKKLVLLHTSSSTTIRSIPRDLIKKAIKDLLDFDPNVIVVTWDKIEDIRKDVDKYLGPRKNRHVNLQFKNVDFDSYVNIISQMDAVVTVDTSSYHIADSFDIPTLVIFQTIEPDLRIKYYPYCEGVKLIKNNKLNGIHLSFDKKHQEYLNEHWKKFKLKDHLHSLKKMMIKKQHALDDTKNYVSCPVCHSLNYKKPCDNHQMHSMFKCEHCDLEFAIERKEPNREYFYKSLKEHFMPDTTKTTPEQIVAKYLSNARYEQYVDFMKALPHKGKYLDYGCANGFLVKFAEDLGFESYGIDASKDVVNYGKTTFGFKTGQLLMGYNLDVIQDTFDVISSFDVIEQLINPKAFAKQVYAKLTPGGFWVFSTMNRDRLQYAAGAKNPLKHGALLLSDYPLNILQRFNENSIKELLRDTGFEIFQIKTNRTFSEVVEYISGPFPDITINVDNKPITLPKEDLRNFMFGYYQQAFDSLQDTGNYTITIARKPKN